MYNKNKMRWDAISTEKRGGVRCLPTLLSYWCGQRHIPRVHLFDCSSMKNFTTIVCGVVVSFAVLYYQLSMSFRMSSNDVLQFLSDSESSAFLLTSLISPLLSDNQTAVPASSPPLKDVEDDFSMCVLTMEDNHRLPEWIAYHYFAWNLRYLVVAVDPHSRTSPQPIFDRWRDRITIVVWTDADFTKKNLTRRADFTAKDNRELHKNRQIKFLVQCTKHLKDRNRTWTAYIDTDEFIAINADVIPDAATRHGQPGSIPQMLRELRQDTNNTYPKSGFYRDNPICITMARRLYTGVESTPHEIQANVTPGFNASLFDTLRYRHLSRPPPQRDGLCKTIIDASKIPDELMEFDRKFNPGSVHRPFAALCPSKWVQYDYPLGVHHYLGSLEAYWYRDDVRKNYIKTLDIYRERALNAKGPPDDEIRLWLSGFVNMVGPAEAARLLQGNGEFDYSWRNTTTSNETAAG